MISASPARARMHGGPPHQGSSSVDAARPHPTNNGSVLLIQNSVLPPISATLKERTTEAHRRLEARAAMGDEFVPDTVFSMFLLAMYLFLDRVEPALERFDHAWRTFKPTLRDRAASDLVVLGPRLDRPHPTGVQVAAPSTLDEAWGYAYVLEGARLGGRMLVDRFRATHPQRPTSYLWSEADRGRWTDFRTRLDAATLRETIVVRAARTAFRDLEHCIEFVRSRQDAAR